MSVNKRFISAQELNELSFDLADIIFRSGVRPTWIVGVWRGGAQVAVCVQEYLSYRGLSTKHVAIKAESYTSIGVQSQVRVSSLEYIIENANSDDVLVIIDDIFDTGRTMKAIVSELKVKMRNNLPSRLFIATVFYKPEKNATELQPDFYSRTTGDWIDFDHELDGLTPEEIRQYKPQVARLIEQL